MKKATETASFLRSRLYSNSEGLLRSIYISKDGDVEQISSPIRAFVDDYAFLVRALLDLYEVTYDPGWIAWAAELQDRQDKLFWDEAEGAQKYFEFWVKSGRLGTAGIEHDYYCLELQNIA